MQNTNRHPNNITRRVIYKNFLINKFLKQIKFRKLFTCWPVNDNRLRDSRLRFSPARSSQYGSPVRSSRSWEEVTTFSLVVQIPRFARALRNRTTALTTCRNLGRDRNITLSFALTCKSVFLQVSRILSITVARRLHSAFRMPGDLRTMQGPVVRTNGPRFSLSLGNSFLRFRNGAFSKDVPQSRFPLPSQAVNDRWNAQRDCNVPWSVT